MRCLHQALIAVSSLLLFVVGCGGSTDDHRKGGAGAESTNESIGGTELSAGGNGEDGGQSAGATATPGARATAI